MEVKSQSQHDGTKSGTTPSREQPSAGLLGLKPAKVSNLEQTRPRRECLNCCVGTSKVKTLGLVVAFHPK